MCTTLVWDLTRTGSGQLFHVWLSCGTCTNRSVVWCRSIYVDLHGFPYGFWRYAILARRIRYHWGSVLEPCLPSRKVDFLRLHPVDLVGHSLSSASLRRRFDCWQFLCVFHVPPPSLQYETNNFTVAAATFYVAKNKFLARLQPDKEFRWDYDFLEIGNSYSHDYSYALNDFDGDYHSEDDEWTMGSSSSISSGSRSPTDDNHSVWESGSETLAGQSDSETIDVWLPIHAAHAGSQPVSTNNVSSMESTITERDTLTHASERVLFPETGSRYFYLFSTLSFVVTHDWWQPWDWCSGLFFPFFFSFPVLIFYSLFFLVGDN